MIFQRLYVVWVLLVLVLRISDLAELSQGRRERVCTEWKRPSMKGSSMQAQDKDNRQSSDSQAAPLRGGREMQGGT